MDNPNDKPDLARRSLLKFAPLGAIAVAAAAHAGTDETPPPAGAAAPEPQQASGYRETEHIRRYYRTAAYW